VFINLEPDNRTETRRLFDALSRGGKIEMALQEMFWGGYFGSLCDRFGARWMSNCASKTQGPGLAQHAECEVSYPLGRGRRRVV
jgi:uncharacterized glyoxalase superfamily protein PhnB